MEETAGRCDNPLEESKIMSEKQAKKNRKEIKRVWGEYMLLVGKLPLKVRFNLGMRIIIGR